MFFLPISFSVENNSFEFFLSILIPSDVMHKIDANKFPIHCIPNSITYMKFKSYTLSMLFTTWVFSILQKAEHLKIKHFQMFISWDKNMIFWGNLFTLGFDIELTPIYEIVCKHWRFYFFNFHYFPLLNQLFSAK